MIYDMDIELQTITCQEINDGFVINGDDYKLFENDFLKVRKDILLSNPNLTDYTTPISYLIRADGVIIGTLFPFPTKFKAGNDIYTATSASDLYVVKEYEKYAPGADLVMAPIKNKNSYAVILGDISAEGMACYHAFRFFDFALPKMIQPHNSRFILENVGLSGVLLKIAYSFLNAFLKPFVKIVRARLKRFAQKYYVERLEEVPDWVDDMVINDGHKYMEIHDSKWIRWCINNTFVGNCSRQMDLYGIYDISRRPIGFFVIREKNTSIPSRNISEMRMGTIMEWGSYDESQLSEYDITKIAVSCFSDKIDAIQYASSNNDVIKKMRKYGFLHHNYHHVVFKDCKKLFKDAKDSTLWRLRWGYGDSMFS